MIWFDLTAYTTVHDIKSIKRQDSKVRKNFE